MPHACTPLTPGTQTPNVLRFESVSVVDTVGGLGRPKVCSQLLAQHARVRCAGLAGEPTWPPSEQRGAPSRSRNRGSNPQLPAMGNPRRE